MRKQIKTHIRTEGLEGSLRPGDGRWDKGEKSIFCGYGDLPYTDFIRTETLCQGGKICDFRFVRHATDAGDGWERTKSI